MAHGLGNILLARRSLGHGLFCRQRRSSLLESGVSVGWPVLLLPSHRPLVRVNRRE